MSILIRCAPFALTLAALTSTAAAQNLDAVTQPGANIQRTMRLLEESTPQKRHTVRVLFYGQSITAGQWSKLTAEYLKKHYPQRRSQDREPGHRWLHRAGLDSHL